MLLLPILLALRLAPAPRGAGADLPRSRGYWRGADRLFLDAVIFGPSGL
jgi:hypothetical protein